MTKPRFAKDIMVTNLVTLSPETDILQAIEKLLRNQISGAPVIDEKQRFLGVISERSCLQALMDAAYHELPSDKVSAFMDAECLTIGEDTEIQQIVHIFVSRKGRRLPVLRDGKLVGQISRRDVLRCALDRLEVPPGREKNPLLYLSALWERDQSPIG